MHPTLTPSDFFTTLQHENILVENDLDLSQFSFKEIGGIVPGRVHWLQCIINGQTAIDIERNEPVSPEQVLRKSYACAGCCRSTGGILVQSQDRHRSHPGNLAAAVLA